MHFHPRTAVLIASLGGFAFQSCEEDFSPKAPFEQKLVVFSLLTEARDTQYVVVSRTYDVDGFDPYENRAAPEVTDAVVRVTMDDGTSVMFRDTTVERQSRDRYAGDAYAYYAAPFRVLPRRTYRLEVNSSSYGVVTASFQTPNEVSIGHSIDRNTGDFLITSTSLGAKGFLIRLFIVFAETRNGVRIERVVEVPAFISNDGTAVYPEVDRISRRRFLGDVIASIREDVLRSDSLATVKEVGRRIVVWSLESNAYNYYQISRGFNDPYSVRVDEPDFTNIVGGLGVFGGILVDSVLVPTE